MSNFRFQRLSRQPARSFSESLEQPIEKVRRTRISENLPKNNMPEKPGVTFEDVTEKADVKGESGGFGAAVGRQDRKIRKLTVMTA